MNDGFQGRAREGEPDMERQRHHFLQDNQKVVFPAGDDEWVLERHDYVGERSSNRKYFKRARGTVTDLINGTLQSASYMAKDANRFFLIPISMMLRTTGQQVWWTKNVSELLFDGFVNPVQTLGVYVKGPSAPDRFGFFYRVSGGSGIKAQGTQTKGLIFLPAEKRDRIPGDAEHGHGNGVHPGHRAAEIRQLQEHHEPLPGLQDHLRFYGGVLAAGKR